MKLFRVRAPGGRPGCPGMSWELMGSPGSSRELLGRPKTTSRTLESVSRTASDGQRGPRSGPRQLQDGPMRSQDGPRAHTTPQEGPESSRKPGLWRPTMVCDRKDVKVLFRIDSTQYLVWSNRPCTAWAETAMVARAALLPLNPAIRLCLESRGRETQCDRNVCPAVQGKSNSPSERGKKSCRKAP